VPFYTFKCPNCNTEKEVLQKMGDSNPNCDDCSECGCNRADGTCGCGGKMKAFQMERVFKSVGKPKFKGSGFYETDYKQKRKP
jgi:predicted nucleic acid-binding Zn ribbon protein